MNKNVEKLEGQKQRIISCVTKSLAIKTTFQLSYNVWYYNAMHFSSYFLTLFLHVNVLFLLWWRLYSVVHFLINPGTQNLILICCVQQAFIFFLWTYLFPAVDKRNPGERLLMCLSQTHILASHFSLLNLNHRLVESHLTFAFCQEKRRRGRLSGVGQLPSNKYFVHSPALVLNRLAMMSLSILLHRSAAFCRERPV